MMFEVSEPTALRLKATRCLDMARVSLEPRRSELMRLAEDYARQAWALAQVTRL